MPHLRAVDAEIEGIGVAGLALGNLGIAYRNLGDAAPSSCMTGTS